MSLTPEEQDRIYREIRKGLEELAAKEAAEERLREAAEREKGK